MNLMEQIEKIPGKQGFWKNSTRDAYHSAAFDLIALGMSDDNIVKLFNSLYSSTVEEYGE